MGFPNRAIPDPTAGPAGSRPPVRRSPRGGCRPAAGAGATLHHRGGRALQPAGLGGGPGRAGRRGDVSRADVETWLRPAGLIGRDGATLLCRRPKRRCARPYCLPSATRPASGARRDHSALPWRSRWSWRPESRSRGIRVSSGQAPEPRILALSIRRVEGQRPPRPDRVEGDSPAGLSHVGITVLTTGLGGISESSPNDRGQERPTLGRIRMRHLSGV